MGQWCGGDLAKLEAKLRLLGGSNDWLGGQAVDAWAKRIATNPKAKTGSAAAPTNHTYVNGTEGF